MIADIVCLNAPNNTVVESSMLDHLDFDSVTESDIKQLIENSVPEGHRLDFKREIYGSEPAEKREFLKDISALANTSGGHLIIGMDEEEGVATSIYPQKVDPDEEVLRMNNLARDGISPPIQGLLIRAVKVDEGHCFFVRVPESWNAPHKVIHKGDHRFYARNSSGVDYLSTESIRTLVTRGAELQTLIESFVENRIEKIRKNHGPATLSDKRGKLSVHLVPLRSFSKPAETIDMRSAHTDCKSLRTLEGVCFTGRFNIDGYLGSERHGTLGDSYIQLYRSGVMESVENGFVQTLKDQGYVAAHHIEERVLGSLLPWMHILSRLNINPPHLVFVTLQEVHGAKLAISESMLDNNRSDPFDRPVLALPTTFFESIPDRDELHRLMRPAFDALWNASGRAFAWSFDDNDVWSGGV
ncbi:hypothetical protein GTQ45_11700 [Pyruvatibacter mobilis]|uniref:Schlafen AlbA-2 domain-containing protein n=1 Tax=Pyruvatibacter mobilis TaxID=1712261 RepID=A0A845QD97_9HYPH|nr:ATP-binding protein [Pyruvatibacter mobilis]NBG96397.1 hypothetical protein [Pyruvatibacter mobilis]QJD75880.1 ATP-binding protein [Pyruvatibacter mobilis]